MKIEGLLKPEDIIPALSAHDKEEVLHELAAKAAGRNSGLDGQEVFRILMERERLGSTGIGDGIAIPHGKLKRINGPMMIVGRSPAGIPFNSLDDRPVHIFFLLIAPEEAVGVHLKMLARISRILKDPAVRRGLMEAAGADEIHAVILKQDSRY